MRDNVGIVEISSELMRNLLHDACASLGKVSVYADLERARRAFEQQAPKLLVLGAAPLGAAGAEFLHMAVHQQCVIGLAFVEGADKQAALHAGALDVYPRNPEGLTHLSYRLRPLLAQSLRPPPEARNIITWSSRAPAGSGASIKALGSHLADETLRRSEPPQPSAANAAARCPMIALCVGPHSESAVAYVLSRLATTLPGIVLLRSAQGAGANALVHRVTEETAWRVHEAQHGEVLRSGSVLIAPDHAQLRIELSSGGPQIALSRGRPSLDVAFESIARTYGAAGALGVQLITPEDAGNRGLRALRDAGGYTIAELDLSSDTQRSSRRVTQPGDAAVERVALNELPQTIAAYCASRSTHSALKPPPRR
jgi:two-component system chemotaxis response regulator CheB